MKPLYLLSASALLAGVSCERHSFEDTKVLHESHGDHAKHAEDGHVEGGPGHEHSNSHEHGDGAGGDHDHKHGDYDHDEAKGDE